MKEEWRTIDEYPNYMVSNLGRVKSLNYGKEKILKQAKNHKGYHLITLSKNNIRKQYFVHRLVALHFIPNPNNYPQVNHKDENKQNNCANNLEYCTAEYNNNYGLHNERVAKARQRPILQFSKSGNIILGKYDSAKQVEIELNINRGHICECCKGKLKSCGGSKWMYYDDYINRMNYYFNLALKNVS